MKTIKDMWENFKVDAVPSNLPEIQKFETEVTFYSGALAALILVLASTDEGVEEEEGAERIKNLFKECTDFRNSLTGNR